MQLYLMLSLRSRRDDRATKGMRNISSSTRSHKFAAGCDSFVDSAPASYLACRRETNLSEIQAPDSGRRRPYQVRDRQPVADGAPSITDGPRQRGACKPVGCVEA
jgi:hypothetical protein